jgi:hypothetical protein
MYATGGSNLVAYNSGVVAKGQVDGAASVGAYSRAVTLEPATAYVLSAYVWNMGNAANHVNTVIDLNDAPSEPQIVTSYSDSEADKGYFVYRSFNTSTTGTNVVLRAFYDGFTGTGTSPAYFPVAAQWDNIAITKAANFVAPQASNSAATLRPLVSIVSPADGALAYADSQAGLTFSANALDLDGSITNVQFFAGTNLIGTRSTVPWSITWNSPPSGPLVLTAVAADNSGATTLSAPVAITLTVSPALPVLRIATAATNVSLLWPTGEVTTYAQSASNLSASVWEDVTNSIVVAGSTNTLLLPAVTSQKFYRLASEVDPTTLNRKLLMGYQGWFACPNDGSPVNAWVHWFRNNTPTAMNLTIDFWPDTSEFEADELFATSLTYSNGAPAKLYSAYSEKTVRRHFKWMRDYHLDGVFLQRFSGELTSGAFFALRNQVVANVRKGADTYGRTFAIMYDISGHPTNTLISTLTNDWTFLVNTLQITNSRFYLRHNGKPVVAIWGFGFAGRPDTPEQGQEAINFFKAAGCTVMGGLPTYWRTQTPNTDTQTNSAWAQVFRSFDVISPWSVGRYGDNAGADNFRLNLIVPDLADATNAGREYMPVIFPGFSWHNLHNGDPANPLNQIPRNGGEFYWRQAYNAVRSGCTMVYGAMFDEVDEGTAMYKLAPTPAELPAQGTFVPLNIDGTNLPSDWYLKLANEAGKMLRGDIPLQSTMPIAP